jgi:hypothetical protein
MSEGQVLTLLAGALAVASSVIGIGIWVGRVSTKADSANKRSHALAEKLALFQIEVARDYAPKTQLTDMKADIMAAIHALGERIDRLFQPRG